MEPFWLHRIRGTSWCIYDQDHGTIITQRDIWLQSQQLTVSQLMTVIGTNRRCNCVLWLEIRAPETDCGLLEAPDPVAGDKHSSWAQPAPVGLRDSKEQNNLARAAKVVRSESELFAFTVLLTDKKLLFISWRCAPRRWKSHYSVDRGNVTSVGKLHFYKGFAWSRRITGSCWGS